MKFKPKSIDKIIEGQAFDIDMLLRYQRKGIPLTPAQNDALTHSGSNRLPSLEKLIDDYLKRFMTGTIWSTASSEGWDSQLRLYVHAVADVQAQMIVGERNIGWSGAVIFGPNTVITDSMKYHFFANQSRQVLTGQIDVSIPTGRIDEWKAAVAWKKEQENKKKPIKSAQPVPVPPVKTALDIEIERQIAIKTPTTKGIIPCII